MEPTSLSIPVPGLIVIVIGAIIFLAGASGRAWEGIDDRPLAPMWKGIFIAVGLLMIGGGSYLLMI